jgi:hypothetical protein
MRELASDGETLLDDRLGEVKRWADSVTSSTTENRAGAIMGPGPLSERRIVAQQEQYLVNEGGLSLEEARGGKAPGFPAPRQEAAARGFLGTTKKLNPKLAKH